MSGRVLQFPFRSISFDQGCLAAEGLLSTPIGERVARARELQLDEPETLLALCARLRDLRETSPALVRDEAAFLYRFIAEPKRPIGLFDETDYFLGEIALIAGSACRFLGLRDEARRWLDRAESAFRHTMNPVAEWSRVAYQRLALRMEEREFDEVFELAPRLIQSFQKLEMPEDVLRCRFLEAGALKETERYSEAFASLRAICVEAEALGARKLLGQARCNLVQLHSLLGDADEAVAESRRALPLLQEQKNRVGIAKLNWVSDICSETKATCPLR